jgi:hypothetical protein
MKSYEEPVVAAINAGIERAKNLGLTKPYDVASSITLALKEAGFTIARVPAKRLPKDKRALINILE